MADNSKKERCTFWPNCKKGRSCNFVHPVKHCTNFPNCWFGAHCLYIHPRCRFDRACTRKHCPFTHYGVTAAQTHSTHKKPNPFAKTTKPTDKSIESLTKKFASISIDTKEKKNEKTEEKSVQTAGECRFGANCKKATCRFTHPTECRFGGSCYNSTCTFYHKPIVNTDKFKWVSPFRSE